MDDEQRDKLRDRLRVYAKRALARAILAKRDGETVRHRRASREASGWADLIVMLDQLKIRFRRLPSGEVEFFP